MQLFTTWSKNTKMSTNKKQIVGNTGLLNFVLDIQQAILDGWRITPDSPVNQFGWLYDAELTKDTPIAAILKEPETTKASPGRPKLK